MMYYISVELDPAADPLDKTHASKGVLDVKTLKKSLQLTPLRVTYSIQKRYCIQ